MTKIKIYGLLFFVPASLGDEAFCNAICTKRQRLRTVIASEEVICYKGIALSINIT
jgi:hypothetical protein